MFIFFSSLICPNFFRILFRFASLTILGAIMFKVSSPCLFLVEAVSFGVLHFLSLAVIFVFEFGLFFLAARVVRWPFGHTYKSRSPKFLPELSEVHSDPY
jgi:hypothetical protein